jgi:hypothetical protein
MKFIKRLFCKHIFRVIPSDYCRIGWARCERCGKERYFPDSLQYTHFSFPKITFSETEDMRQYRMVIGNIYETPELLSGSKEKV